MDMEFFRQAEEFIFMENSPEKSDVIFVPGNAYPQMAEKAARLYGEGYAPYVLPSGKYSIVTGHFAGAADKAELYQGMYETEWEFLKDVLVKNGVPSQAVLKEDQATYTYENAIFSRRVLDQRGISVKKAILCCRSCHARRSWLYYSRLFPEAEILVCPADVGNITKANWRETEAGIDAVTGEIARIIKQFSLLMD